MHACLSDNAFSHFGKLKGISPACVTSAILALKIRYWTVDPSKFRMTSTHTVFITLSFHIAWIYSMEI